MKDTKIKISITKSGTSKADKLKAATSTTCSGSLEKR